MADTDADLRQLAYAICAHAECLSLDALHEAGEIAVRDPAQLTDRQLQAIAAYQPGRILTLVRARAAAQQADRDAAEQRRAVEEHQRQAAATPAPIDLTSLDGLSFVEICAACPDVPVTMELLGKVVTFMEDMNTKNSERNTKIAALEQQLADLKVELDAWVQVRS